AWFKATSLFLCAPADQHTPPHVPPHVTSGAAFGRVESVSSRFPIAHPQLGRSSQQQTNQLPLLPSAPYYRIAAPMRQNLFGPGSALAAVPLPVNGCTTSVGHNPRCASLPPRIQPEYHDL